MEETPQKDPDEDRDALFHELYDELKVIAVSQMRGERAWHTLQPTALVNEAYLRLVESRNNLEWQNEKHFLCTVAEVMRRVLIDAARAKLSKKRGGDLAKVELKEIDSISEDPLDDILSVHEALKKLEKISPEKAQLVSLRFFTGLTIEEAANVIAVSSTTARRYWDFSRAWLYAELTS